MLTATADASSSMVLHDHFVAVFGRLESPQILASLLCEVNGMSPIDAVFSARHIPGVLPLSFTLAEAQSLVARLAALGIKAGIIAESVLPKISQCVTIHHARITEDALEICDLRGQCATRILWERVAVIAIGSVPGESHLRFIDDGRPSVVSAAPMPSAGRLATPQRPNLELWFLCRGPTAVYCIKHDEFNYETLGEACASSAAENFDRFVRRLVEKASTARRTPGAYAFLHRMLSGYECKSSDALQQQALLGWALDHFGLAPSVE